MDPLPIFPQGALRESVITTVWIGVCVASWFNLRLGWTFSGLVAPGYLVPLMIVEPLSAAVILLEAVMTYGLVWFYSEVASKTGWWSNVFGRDRFFAILLASILVRLSMDGWLLPLLGNLLESRGLLSMELVSDLHSFGTIVVALIANALWKPGLRYGCLTFGIQTFITFLVVRYGLAVFTNFNIGGLDYLYEDFAQSFLASPKVYIVLITIAYIASKFNMWYGWEYSGILLPALLGLLWYQPYKIATSLLEMTVVLMMAKVFVQLPYFRDWTIEGARKLVIFFNLSFLYKLLVGHLLSHFDLAWQTSDFYGFGYLLPTLLAVKVHDKSIPLRLTVATVTVAVMGTLVASVIGFGLTKMGSLFPSSEFTVQTQPLTLIKQNDVSPVDRMLRSKPLFYAHFAPIEYRQPSYEDLRTFETGLEAIRRSIEASDLSMLERGCQMLKQIGFEAEMLQSRYLYLYQNNPSKGWGVYLLDTQTKDGLVLEIPSLAKEWRLLDASLQLFMDTQASALAIGGEQRNDRSRREMTGNRRSCFHSFHRVFKRPNVLQLSKAPERRMNKMTEMSSFAAVRGKSSLWVQGRLPKDLNLRQLERLIASLLVEWRRAPFKNIQADISANGFAELFLSSEDLRQLLLKANPADDSMDSVQQIEALNTDLNTWMMEINKSIAPRNSNGYRSAEIGDLLFLDRDLFQPMMHICREEFDKGQWTQAGLEELVLIRSAAESIGYRVDWIRSPVTEETHLVLHEVNQESPRHWGTFILRAGGANSLSLEVPRPISESFTLPFALSVSDYLKPDSIVVAGAHAHANTDGTSDLIQWKNKSNPLNLWTQVWLREENSIPQLALQIRGFRDRETDSRSPDILLANARSFVELNPEQDPVLALIDRWKALNYDLIRVNSDNQWSRYQNFESFGAQYIEMTEVDQYGTCWVSSSLRSSFKPDDGLALQSRFYRAAGLEVQTDDLLLWLREISQLPSLSIPPELKRQAENLVEDDDIALVAKLRKEWPDVTLKYLIDSHTRQAMFVMFQDLQHLPWIIRATPRLDARSEFALNWPPKTYEDLAAFWFSGAAWLNLGGSTL